MKKTDLKRFRKILETKRDYIVNNAESMRQEGMILDTDDLPDEMDLASSEGMQSFQFRLRGREKSFLSKIERALKKQAKKAIGNEPCGLEVSHDLMWRHQLRFTKLVTSLLHMIRRQ